LAKEECRKRRIGVNDDDFNAGMKMAFGLPRSLEGMSIDSLKEYRAALEQEIKHVDSALEHRKGAHAGAEALFKS
tara:strand:- start:162 stop:386 length:225 start_codon:yes stop_codon:yes gene_type:complete